MVFLFAFHAGGGVACVVRRSWNSICSSNSIYIRLLSGCMCVYVVECERIALSECLRNSNSSEKPTCVPWCGENRVK